MPPGDVVILDNLAAHKQPAIRVAIEHVGALLQFLVSYSPDFNPIEQAFAKLKALVRAVRPALRLSRYYMKIDNALAFGDRSIVCH